MALSDIMPVPAGKFKEGGPGLSTPYHSSKNKARECFEISELPDADTFGDHACIRLIAQQNLSAGLISYGTVSQRHTGRHYKIIFSWVCYIPWADVRPCKTIEGKGACAVRRAC